MERLQSLLAELIGLRTQFGYQGPALVVLLPLLISDLFRSGLVIMIKILHLVRFFQFSRINCIVDFSIPFDQTFSLRLIVICVEIGNQ